MISPPPLWKYNFHALGGELEWQKEQHQWESSLERRPT
jgi:hypothetical protein